MNFHFQGLSAYHLSQKYRFFFFRRPLPMVGVFDIPNPNRYDILSIDILQNSLIDIDIDIDIFKNGHIDIDIDIDIFQIVLIDIDIDIFKIPISISISISIFFKSVDISTIDISYRYFNKEKE